MERKLPNLTLVKLSPFGSSYYLMQHDQPSLCIEERQTLGGVPSAKVAFFCCNCFIAFFTTMRHLLSLYPGHLLL